MPTALKMCFFINIRLKITMFFKISKKRIYVVALIVCYLHAKFELGNSIFDKVMAKQLLKIDDVKQSNSIVCRC